MTSLWRARLAGILMALLAAMTTLPAIAVTIIRDAEIERSLRELARPLMAAAGVNPAQVNIWVIHSDATANVLQHDCLSTARWCHDQGSLSLA